jgi:hypothetical protein
MLAEIFMLRVEAEARPSREPNPARFVPLNPAGGSTTAKVAAPGGTAKVLSLLSVKTLASQ